MTHNLSFDFYQKNKSSVQAIRKYSQLREILLSYPSALLAYSGGVDSTFLLAAWHEVWKDKKKNRVDVTVRDNKVVTGKSARTDSEESESPRLLACTILSPLLPTGTAEDVQKMVDFMDAEHRFLQIDPLREPFMSKNEWDRCYHCKLHLFQSLVNLAKKEKISFLFDGTNVDDLKDFRPGHRALSELAVFSPLAEAKLTKDEIRFLSKEMGLPTWNLPSMACLASRIPYGVAVDKKKLQQIDAAELVLHKLGFPGSRVRYHGDGARIEIDERYGRNASFLLEEPYRSHVISALKEIGFRYISLDLEGYRMGSLNPNRDSLDS
ncbi:ATP-dependent sacrificial sulfur transferase LarE [Heliorestis convoluta]|uniref:ATP-dependent sacrificial sulfur transferase LarE n=1 Tax=Heliorestis convoluta TaxID=356322 RepID=A0A5Q2MZW8_9FIRM|nr:ATP-dependent sacrificial sulfur transferase LarE [Heliorestis convoluta]QGG47003.1 ATP-dependent sacrificial sulfur transferase LarE [Heliorestis convoluta]